MADEGDGPRFVIVRRFDAPAALVWRSLVALLDRSGTAAPRPSEVGGEVHFTLDDWTLVERTFVSDAPHRRVYRVIDGAPVRMYEGTSTIVDGADGSELTWTIVADPIPGREDEFAAFIARAEVAVTRGVDAVVAGVPPLDGARTHRFTYERLIARPPQRVWQAIERMYAGAEYSETVATTPPYGEGAIIRYSYGDWWQHALVARWRPPHERVYEMLDGAPVSRYRGTTTVAATPDGSRLTWEGAFALGPDGAHPAEDVALYLQLAEETVGRAVDRVVALAEA